MCGARSGAGEGGRDRGSLSPRLRGRELTGRTQWSPEAFEEQLSPVFVGFRRIQWSEWAATGCQGGTAFGVDVSWRSSRAHWLSSHSVNVEPVGISRQGTRRTWMWTGRWRGICRGVSARLVEQPYRDEGVGEAGVPRAHDARSGGDEAEPVHLEGQAGGSVQDADEPIGPPPLQGEVGVVVVAVAGCPQQGRGGDAGGFQCRPAERQRQRPHGGQPPACMEQVEARGSARRCRGRRRRHR